MSEEEIIENVFYEIKLVDKKGFCSIGKTSLQGLLDLYYKEKEERQKFEKAFKQRMEYSHELEKDLFENSSNYVISKDKIKEISNKYENAIENSSILTRLNQFDLLRVVINDLDELLEG